MTTLRTAAQQALEALEAMNPYPASREDQRTGALTALRAALAQPEGGGNLPPPLQAEPEPCAMRYGYDGYGYLYIDAGSGSDWRTRVKGAEPLYTAPPKRKPLTLADLQEALVLTNLIDRDAIEDPNEYDKGSTLAQIDALHRIIKEDK